MSLLCRLVVVLCLSLLVLAVLPGTSFAAGRRGPSSPVPGDGADRFIAVWAVRAWSALTGLTDNRYVRLSGASGMCIDPNGTCAPAPPTSVTTPPTGSGG